MEVMLVFIWLAWTFCAWISGWIMCCAIWKRKQLKQRFQEVMPPRAPCPFTDEIKQMEASEFQERIKLWKRQEGVE